MSYSTACVRPKLDIFSFEHTSYPIFSVDNTPLPLVSEAAKLFSLKRSKYRRAPRPATMGFDGQELATRWPIVVKLRNPGFSWDIGSCKANGNGSGDVEGLRSYAQALIPVLDMPLRGFTSHASMGDALQAVHKTHEVFGRNSDGAALGHGEHGQRVLEAHV